LWKIVVPLTSAAIGSVAVFQFTGIWNSYMLPLVVLRRENLMLLPQRLSRFIGQYEIQYSELFAGIMITFLPVVIFFVMFQKSFFQGTTMGAVKE
jgi:ABC-type glycerol-3-phosphate transport system permease component